MKFKKRFLDKKKGLLKHVLGITALTASLSNTAYCTQASIDYVKNAIDAFRGEVHSIISALPFVTPKLLDIYQGGIVFYVDESKQHGLVASLKDLNEEPGIAWRNGEGGDRMTNAKARGLYGGETNTRLIVAGQTIDDQQGQFAALLASSLQVGADGLRPCIDLMTVESICYSGWYLPSIYELFLMQSQLHLSGGLYWSSTEVNEAEALSMDFETGDIRSGEKSMLFKVRAIHAF